MTTTISPEQFIEKVEELAEAFQQSVAREAGLDYLAEMADEWDIDEYSELFNSLKQRGFGKRGVGQIVLYLLEAAVSEGYVKPQLQIVKDVMRPDGTVDWQETEFIPAVGIEEERQHAPYCYFDDNCDAGIYINKYTMPDGWRLSGASFSPADEAER